MAAIQNCNRSLGEVRKIGNTFGAEISINISEELIDKRSRDLYEYYLDHKVLVFKRQSLNAALFAKFGEVFGIPDQHHVVQLRHPEYPTLTYLSNQDEAGRTKEARTSGQGWHSDYSYKLIPGAATMLWGLEIPEQGGDTLFADEEAAFADLDEAEKRRLRRMRVLHHYRWSPDRSDPWARWKYIGPAERRMTPPVTHPLVRINPDTGRETMFLQPKIVGSVVGIEGMREEESDNLIAELIEHATSTKYLYRHKWDQDDVVVWDNRRLLHTATTKDLDESQVRRLLRLTTVGQPVTPSEPATGYSRLATSSAGSDDE